MTPNNSLENKENKELMISFGIYSIIFILKFLAYFVTGIMILLAEALHTLTDMFISGFLLISLWYSSKEPDDIHNFGYERVQYIASLVAATLFIAFTSYELYSEAIPKLFDHGESEFQNIEFAIIVILFSILLSTLPLFRILRQKIRGPTLKAQLKELINDQLGLLAALIGIIFIKVGLTYADPIVTIFVATIIAVNGILLFIDNSSYLIGKSLDGELVSRISKVSKSVGGVVDVHDIKSMYLGPQKVQVLMHVEIDGDKTVKEAHSIMQNIMTRVHNEIDLKGEYCMIHIDPVIND